MNKPLTRVEHAQRLTKKLNRQMSMASNAAWAMQSTVDEIEAMFGSAFSDPIQRELNKVFASLTELQEFTSVKQIFKI